MFLCVTGSERQPSFFLHSTFAQVFLKIRIHSFISKVITWGKTCLSRQINRQMQEACSLFSKIWSLLPPKRKINIVITMSLMGSSASRWDPHAAQNYHLLCPFIKTEKDHVFQFKGGRLFNMGFSFLKHFSNCFFGYRWLTGRMAVRKQSEGSEVARKE